MTLSEHAVDFGESTALTGVLTQPAVQKDPDLAVILLNAGLISRSGPLRMNVELARHLAGNELACFRIDLSRMGYSPARETAGDIIEDAVADTVEGMDMLQQRYGFKRFILGGLCSGAENAHAAALQDDRVVGVIYLDGYTYSTPKSRALSTWRRKVMHYLVRAIRPDYWARWIRTRFGPSDTDSAATADTIIWEPNYISREDYRRQIDILTARGVDLMLVFAGYEVGYQYHNQFFDAFPGLDTSKIQVNHFKDADHIFFIRSDREEMYSTITTWAARCRRDSARASNSEGELAGA